jgi:hypothetical protein
MAISVFVLDSFCSDGSVHRVFALLEGMAQACLTQYFTPKQSRRSSTLLAHGELIKSHKRKYKFDDENIENVCSKSIESNKKRRISTLFVRCPLTFVNVFRLFHVQVQRSRPMVTYRNVISIKSIRVCQMHVLCKHRDIIILCFTVPLSRKNAFHTEEKTIKTFERQKQRLAKVADMSELREHLKAIRTHVDQVKIVRDMPVSNEVHTP